MKPFRFIHTADWHLDAPFKGLAGLPRELYGRIRDSSFHALDALVELAIREQSDFVLVSGDLFDAADRSLRAQRAFQQAAERLSEQDIPLYAVHGNHDPLQGYRARLALPDNVHVFGGEQVETVVVNGRDGEPMASVSGISYARPAVTENLAARFPAPDPSLFAIAMLHTNVDGDAGHDNYAPASSGELSRAGYDYWALGHVHNRKVLMEQPWIVYPGNLQGRSVRETGAKGAYVVDVDSTGRAALRFHPLHAVRWEQLAVSIAGMADEQALMDKLERVLAEQARLEPGVPVVARLVLEGRGPLHRQLQHDATLAEWIGLLREQFGTTESGSTELPEDGFVWIESVRLHTGDEWALGDLAEQESFLGDLVRLADGLLQDEAAMQAFYEEAAAPLLTHARAGRRIRPAETADMRAWLAAARELALAELMDGEERN